MRADDMVRDVDLYGECPKCETPGLHLMPCRVLLLKLKPSKVERTHDEMRMAEGIYYARGRYSYGYDDSWESERVWLEEARAKYRAAVRAAEHHVYALKRVCYVDGCRHEWFELLSTFESDLQAELLQTRYPEGLVVRHQS